MIRVAVIALALAGAAEAADLDVPRFLDAVQAVEGWNGRDGAAGERGPWQVTRAVWSMHMPGIPFAQARREGPARACAVKHVRYLAARLAARGVAPLPFNIALAWNAGLGGVLRGTAPVRAYDYATRVCNLYQSAAPLIVVSTRTLSDSPAAKPHEARPLHFQPIPISP